MIDVKGFSSCHWKKIIVRQKKMGLHTSNGQVLMEL
jgi:hypothetical protein